MKNKKRELFEGNLYCSKCKLYKSLDQFHNCKGATFNKAYYCKDCACINGAKHHARRMQEVPEYRKAMRDRYIKSKFGFKSDKYVEMLQAQGSICAICEIALLPHGSGTHLDHCHQTGKLRAFLCTNCNRGLGHFKDSPKFLRVAASYVEAHNGS